MLLTWKNLDQELAFGVDNLKELLQFENGPDGIEMTVSKGDGIQVSLKDGKGSIVYKEKCHFFRGLGLFIEAAREKDEFFIEETPRFEELGVMLDESRGGVDTVDAIKRYINCMAVMGLNMLMLYTEDTFKLENYPMFGFMRGRYTQEELKACDDYAYAMGVELVACIETCGHMEQYLRWGTDPEIMDSYWTLLAGSEATYKLLDEMIRTITAPLRSKKINIGLDECFYMGQGGYMVRHGYRDGIDIFSEHIRRIVEITDKYGLEPMMWTDTLTALTCNGICIEGAPFDEDAEISPRLLEQIPQKVNFVAWNYVGDKVNEEKILRQQMATGRDVYLAGGTWTWQGHTCENYWTLRHSRYSLQDCKRIGLKKYFTTVWSSNGCETDHFASLLSLQQTAEEDYRDTVSDEELKKRFEFCTGGNFDILMRASEFNHAADAAKDFFMGKKFLWQDILQGSADSYLLEHPMSGRYRALCDYVRENSSEADRWKNYHEFLIALFDVTAKKCYIAENLKPAYDRGDREFLQKCVSEYLPELSEAVGILWNLHKRQWFSDRKAFGWEMHDVRYSGIQARCRTAMERIGQYLNGQLSELEELAEDRTDYMKGSWYDQIASTMGRM